MQRMLLGLSCRNELPYTNVKIIYKTKQAFESGAMEKFEKPESVANDIVFKWSDAHKFSPAPRHRRRIISSIIRRIEFEYCLDVGCAQPYLLDDLSRRGKGVFGCDISYKVIEANRKNFPQVEFEIVDISKDTYPANKKFDLVISSEVLEHIADWRAAVENLALMSNRYILISVPSGKIHKIDRLVGHLRHYTLAELEQEIEKNDFKVIFYKYWGMPFHTLYKHLINACGHRKIYAQFAEAKFGMKEKVLSLGLYCLFFLNDLFHSGSQLFILAKRSD